MYCHPKTRIINPFLLLFSPINIISTEPKPYVEPGPKPEPEEGEVPPDADPEAQPGFVPANGPNEHAHDEKLSTEVPEAVEADYTLKTDTTHYSSFNSNSEDNLKALFPSIRKLSSKKGKDSRPTMTPRTDKPSDRVTRHLSSSATKEEKLEAKLVKAEKKGDEKLEAKLEKKIEKLSTATEEVAVVEEVAATEPMQAVAPVEAWVEDVVDNTAITTTAPVVAAPATPTTTDVPSKNTGDVASREAGPKGAAKKLAHDGSPETTVTATTETMEEAVPVPTVVRKLSSKKGKDSRPTMTPRTDKPSDRVTRHLSSSATKEEKLEAKLVKAEKKGDEKLEAKLEKKIEKLSTATEEVAVVEEVVEVVPEVEVMTSVESSVATTTDSTSTTSLLPSEIAPREAGPKGAATTANKATSTTTSKDTPKTLIPPTTTVAEDATTTVAKTSATSQMSGPSAQKAATATTTTTTTTTATPVVETATVASTTTTTSATEAVPPAASITSLAPPSATKPSATTAKTSATTSTTSGKPAKTVPPPTTVDTTAADTSIDASTIAVDAVRALGSAAQKSSKKTVAVMDDIKQVKGSVSIGAAAAKASASKLITKSSSSSGSKTLVKNADASVNGHRQIMGESSRGEPPVGMQAAHPTGVLEAAAEALKDKVPSSTAILSTPIRGDDKKAPVPNTAHQMGEIDWLYRAGSPTKSPSAGLHKPTWKPSFKPVENSMTSSVFQGNSVFSSATTAATPSTPIKQSSPLTAPKTIIVDGVNVVPTPLAEYGLAHPRPGDNTLFRN